MSRPGSSPVRPSSVGVSAPRLTRRGAVLGTVALAVGVTPAVDALAARPAYPGVRERGNLLGPESAPVRIVLFADLKCPACQTFEHGEMPAVVRRLIRTGRAAVELHLVDIIDGNVGTKDGDRLRTTALNLASRNHLWAFSRAVLRRQGDESREWATPGRIEAIARSAGVTVGARSMRETTRSRRAGRADDRLFSKLEATGTPEAWVRRRDGGPYVALSATTASGIEEGVGRLERGGTP
jgi:hypothetical protein